MLHISWNYRSHVSFRQLAICHLLLLISIIMLLLRQWTLVALLWLAMGFGGIGAAWGRHTEQVGQWLDLTGAWHRPDRQVLACTLEHAPFAVLGLILLAVAA